MWGLGTVFFLCERASDWGTERWGNQVRAFLLLGLGVGSLFWGVLGNKVLGVNKMPDDDAYLIALIVGLICGAMGYVIYRTYISPRAPKPKHEKEEVNIALQQRRADKKLSVLEWLLLDFSSIKAIRKARRDKNDRDK